MMVRKVIEEGTDAQFKRCIERLDFKMCNFCAKPLTSKERKFSRAAWSPESYYYCRDRAACQERWSNALNMTVIDP